MGTSKLSVWGVCGCARLPQKAKVGRGSGCALSSVHGSVFQILVDFYISKDAMSAQ